MMFLTVLRRVKIMFQRMMVPRLTVRVTAQERGGWDPGQEVIHCPWRSSSVETL